VQAEGQTAWQPLADVPEFAALIPSTPPSFGVASGFGAMPAAARSAETLRRLNAPGIALMVVGAVTILWSLFNVFGYFTSSTIQKTENPTINKFIEASQKPQALVFGIVQLACGGLMIFGGLKMRKGQSYKLAQTASVLAMIPCTASCCCVVGLPIGIWSLILLNKPEVKAAFES
ncbi:MAG TPA: hypothetical protein VK530_17625, partial [Candidatus Acidoferrum sp.]|nr:hypothetical protein [Candidatus Acidoferrum sp.]